MHSTIKTLVRWAYGEYLFVPNGQWGGTKLEPVVIFLVVFGCLLIEIFAVVFPSFCVMNWCGLSWWDKGGGILLLMIGIDERFECG